MKSFETVIRKIDTASYDAPVLELLSVWLAVEREILRLGVNNDEYIEELKDTKSPEFVEGYIEACQDWTSGLSEENNITQQRFLRLVGVGEIYKQEVTPFLHAFQQYGEKEIDVKGLFQSFKQIAREVYFPALEN